MLNKGKYEKKNKNEKSYFNFRRKIIIVFFLTMD